MSHREGLAKDLLSLSSARSCSNLLEFQTAKHVFFMSDTDPRHRFRHYDLSVEFQTSKHAFFMSDNDPRHRFRHYDLSVRTFRSDSFSLCGDPAFTAKKLAGRVWPTES